MITIDKKEAVPLPPPPVEYTINGLPLEALQALKAFAMKVRINSQRPEWAAYLEGALGQAEIQYTEAFYISGTGPSGDDKFHLKRNGTR